MLLDEKCEWDGGIETVQYLAQSGYTKEDILALNFNEKIVDYALELLQEPTEEVEDSDWDGCCLYCGSSDIDFVDEIDGETKYICRCCNEDFLFDEETGECTDRHRRPIRKEEE